LTSTFLAILVTPSLYTLLDDLQNLVFRPSHTAPPVPTERHTVPAAEHAPAAPGPVLVATAVSQPTSHGNGHANGNGNGNGHTIEPAWLQKLKSGAFEDE
jgi:hypothetical protein